MTRSHYTRVGTAPLHTQCTRPLSDPCNMSVVCVCVL